MIFDIIGENIVNHLFRSVYIFEKRILNTRDCEVGNKILDRVGNRC